jgi:hypothetical protein
VVCIRRRAHSLFRRFRVWHHFRGLHPTSDVERIRSSDDLAATWKAESHFVSLGYGMTEKKPPYKFPINFSSDSALMSPTYYNSLPFPLRLQWVHVASALDDIHLAILKAQTPSLTTATLASPPSRTKTLTFALFLHYPRLECYLDDKLAVERERRE